MVTVVPRKNGSNLAIKMSRVLISIVLSAALFQLCTGLLNVTIFYETLCRDSQRFFRTQLSSAYEDSTIRKMVHFELVPFGKAQFVENPWSIRCQHGEMECLGNAVHACFFAKHLKNIEQVNFGICSMTTSNPPFAGAECARKLKYDYAGVEECARNEEGIKLTVLNGRRTLDFKPKISFIPTIVFNNVYNEVDQKNSLQNFKRVVLQKLNLH